jgi:hypothetical protein
MLPAIAFRVFGNDVQIMTNDDFLQLSQEEQTQVVTMVVNSLGGVINLVIRRDGW